MERVVYGVVQDSLVFIPVDDAEELANVHHALNVSTTWGEFRTSVPSDVYDEVLELIWGDEPDGGAPFSACDIPAVSDGDWPAWPAQEMLRWVPNEIQEQFGRVESSMHNGEFLTFDIRRQAQIVAAFERNGCECRNDEVLVNRACGVSVPDDYARAQAAQPRFFVN
jgi:hypothetical protein